MKVITFSLFSLLLTSTYAYDTDESRVLTCKEKLYENTKNITNIATERLISDSSRKTAFLKFMKNWEEIQSTCYPKKDQNYCSGKEKEVKSSRQEIYELLGKTEHEKEYLLRLQAKHLRAVEVSYSYLCP